MQGTWKVCRDHPTPIRPSVIGPLPCSSSKFVDLDRNYIRDGRAPIPKDTRTSALMSRIRARNTGPERTLRSLLVGSGLRGYRLHPSAVPGRPDVAFIGARVAVFVHGCFWHGCPHCQPPRPRSNRKFWSEKLERNRERDVRKARELRLAGWKVITIWECMLRRAPSRQVQRVARALALRRSGR